MKKSLYRERKAEAFREMLKAKAAQKLKEQLEAPTTMKEGKEQLEQKPKKVSKKNANSNK